MEFCKVLALRGPNVWARFPVLEVWVDLQELKDSPSDELPGFNERLMSWLPTLVEHRCSLGVRGGFFERLRRGTWQAHILEHVTLELQSLAGTDVGFGRAREIGESGVYRVAIEFSDEHVGRASLQAARELCLAAVYNRPFDVAQVAEELRELAQRVMLGPSTRAIVEAAAARGIPVRRLNSGSLVLLGQGARQRRILAAETDQTSAISESIAQDKELTRTLLAAVGIPVPPGRPVESAEDAWAAAEELGLPVVVKPRAGNQGRGVATNLSSRGQVLAAYAAARQEERDVIVEKFAPGQDYRLLVVGDRVVAAARRAGASVTGDGQHSIAELVALANNDPRRGADHATPLSRIHLDSIAQAVLAEQGLDAASVPPAGAQVAVRRNGNLSTGGTASDVTDLVHPLVAKRAVEAARMVGLDIAGVDVVAQDIGQPLERQEAVIVEVNAAPGLRMHVQPSAGAAQPVGKAIVDLMFAPGETGRIPVVAVTGTNGKTTTTRAIAHLLATAGHSVGMTSTDGVFVGGRQIDRGDCSGPQSARAVLLNPWVDAAVLETARGGILREGLGFDECNVAVVTNVAEGDHLGLSGVETAEQLAVVKRTVIEAVATTGWAVLNAQDRLTAAMASSCPGRVCFFGRDAEDPTIVAHRLAGGRAVFARHKQIVLAEGGLESNLVSLARVPLARDGRVAFMVENALAATAAAWCLGLSEEIIKKGLCSLGEDLDAMPGRFNVMVIHGATVVLDYGHNASALQALVAALASFPHAHRTIVYSAAGDRRDEDLIRQGQLLGDSFDKVILYEDHYLRGRAPGEIIKLFQAGLRGAQRTRQVLAIQGALTAVDRALADLEPDHLLIIQADVVAETVDYLRGYVAAHAVERPRLQRVDMPQLNAPLSMTVGLYREESQALSP